MKYPLHIDHDGPVTIKRDKKGIPHIDAESERGLYFGQGYMQAMDRGLQMLLTRILGQGRAGEFLESSDEMLQLDIFFRRMNWRQNSNLEPAKLSRSAKENLHSFCRGINSYFKLKIPWELRILGYRPEPWNISDVILIMRMIGYIGLQQSQQEMERLIVEMLQAGVDRDRLEELFPGRLEGLDEDLLCRVKLGSRMVPGSISWNQKLPRILASNNWVVAGKKTESGKTILATDPHMEANRLPNILQEISLKTRERYLIGATIPGIPGVLIGRNNNLAWGLTYSFMDSVDSWVEKCKGGKFKRNKDSKTKWVRFKERREKIKRKKKPDIIVPFFENEHGVLDGDPNSEGYFLITRWAADKDIGARTLESIFKMFQAKSVKKGMDLMGRVEVSFNWVFADDHGDIGYQMSGLMPKRRSGISGLIPLPGWDNKYDWKGFINHTHLPRRFNPYEGFIITANNDLNSQGRVKPINLPMGGYRAKRIKQLLKAKKKMTAADMAPIQYDLYSLQAERFMNILRPLLPKTNRGEILNNWDCRYSLDSQGAYLFEKFYRTLFDEVFGQLGIGKEVIAHLLEETGIFIDFYENFDRILLEKESLWFAGRNREELYQIALEKALKGSLRKWSNEQRIYLNHILFGGKFPHWFGFDHGPIAIPGGRATPFQGQIYRSGGRVTTFIPVMHMIVDLNEKGILSNLLGGPSDRRFSKWYISDLSNWLQHKFKRILP